MPLANPRRFFLTFPTSTLTLNPLPGRERGQRADLKVGPYVFFVFAWERSAVTIRYALYAALPV